jgi:hypothetical protein
MKKILLLFFILFCFNVSNSQNVFRAVEGGSVEVMVDTITKLNKLISRLEKPWEFNATGKAYWIGYTNDMYLIAKYKDSAIGLLVDFINKSTNTDAKIGGLYTVHLIGIKSKIAGRFFEKFEDTIARNAIIQYINNDKLHETVIELLMRDPWVSDIPIFINYLSEPNHNYSAILSAMQRYEVKNRPFGQQLNDTLYRKKILIKSIKSYSRNPYYDMIALKKSFRANIYIDTAISNSKEWITSIENINNDLIKTEYQSSGTLLSFLTNSVFSYYRFANNFFYCFEKNKLSIYGPIQARDIWLQWWKENKNNFQ